MNSKNKIHVVIDALGGWKRAFALIKPSTSTTVMILTLVTLVVFFPGNQWGWEDGEPTSPPARTTSTTTPPAKDPEPEQTQAPTQTTTQPETVETPIETANTNTWQTPTYDGSDSTKYTEQTSRFISWIKRPIKNHFTKGKTWKTRSYQVPQLTTRTSEEVLS